MWMKRWKKQLISIGLSVTLALGIPAADLPTVMAGSEEEASYSPAGGAGSYEEYLQQYEGTAPAKESVTVEGTFLEEGDGAEWYGVQEDGNPTILFQEGTPYAEYSVDVEQAGLYYITVKYAQTENSSRAIAIGLMLNGAYPFSEAAEISLPRIYQDASGIRTDSIGNEVAPQQAQVLDAQSHVLLNTSGYYEGNYSFYLESGENTIRIVGNGTEFYLMGIQATALTREVTYEEYLKGTSGTDTTGLFLKIQGESAAYKSASVLYPNYDRVNLATEDSADGLNNPQYIRINTVGGNLWNTAGQWISWKVEVPESGYYNLGCKFRQNFLDGLFTSRAVSIDGEVPFSELSEVRFVYDDEWQTASFGDQEGNPYRVYLEKGSHEIRLMCTMGVFADTLRNVNNCIYDINNLYRQIIMITSTNPDTYTDYFLTDRIPNLMETMVSCRDLLEQEIDNIVALTGEHGSKTAVLETLKVQLDTFLEDADEIPNRLSSFKDNISAVGSWLVDIQSQGLLIDYLYLKSPDVEDPEPSAGVFQNMWYSVRRFFAS